MLQRPSGSCAPTRSSFDARTSLDSRSAAILRPQHLHHGQEPPPAPPASSAPSAFAASTGDIDSHFAPRPAPQPPVNGERAQGVNTVNDASYGSLLAFDEQIKPDADEALLTDMLAHDDTLEATRQPRDPLASLLQQDSMSLPLSDTDGEATAPRAPKDAADDDEWRPGLASEEAPVVSGRKRRRASSKSAGAQDVDSRRSRRCVPPRVIRMRLCMLQKSTL